MGKREIKLVRRASPVESPNMVTVAKKEDG
jgi:hypothetical protein